MKKIMKKILIAVLSLAMIACFVPQTGMQVYAEPGFARQKDKEKCGLQIMDIRIGVIRCARQLIPF